MVNLIHDKGQRELYQIDRDDDKNRPQLRNLLGHC